MTRCTVCRLERNLRDAVDSALRTAGVSLTTIASRCGCSKAALHRHRQHLNREHISSKPLANVATVGPVMPLTAAAPAVTRNPEAVLESGSREELLRRIEYLWLESLAGLESSKQPIRIEKPDGTVAELPPDTRARAAFIREARQSLKLQAMANGGLNVAPAGLITIVLPATTRDRIPGQDIQVIDIEPRR